MRGLSLDRGALLPTLLLVPAAVLLGGLLAFPLVLGVLLGFKDATIGEAGNADCHPATRLGAPCRVGVRCDPIPEPDHVDRVGARYRIGARHRGRREQRRTDA